MIKSAFVHMHSRLNVRKAVEMCGRFGSKSTTHTLDAHSRAQVSSDMAPHSTSVLDTVLALETLQDTILILNPNLRTHRYAPGVDTDGRHQVPRTRVAYTPRPLSP